MELALGITARIPTEDAMASDSRCDLHGRKVVAALVSCMLFTCGCPSMAWAQCTPQWSDDFGFFPDLDGAAQFINSNWELGFDSPVGRFRKLDSWYARKGLDFGHKIH